MEWDSFANFEWKKLLDAAGLFLALSSLLARPRYYISIDGGPCKEVVGSSRGPALYVRVKIERFGLKIVNEECQVWLKGVWKNGHQIESESSPLQWTHIGGFDPQRVCDSAWADVCAIYENNPSYLHILSAKGQKGFPQNRGPGQYEFEIEVGGRFSSKGHMRLTIEHSGTHFCNSNIISARSRKKWARLV